MRLNEQIRNHRKNVGLTQEQVAMHLGVSAPAVNKWEKGTTCPDVSLLPALARLLRTDMNELFSFSEELTEPEVRQFVNELPQAAVAEGMEAAFERAAEKIREYPYCDLLRYMCAVILDGILTLSAVEETEKAAYETRILDWLEKVSNGTDEKIKYSAMYTLAAKYLQMEEYQKADFFLECIPDISADKTQLQAKVLMHEKDENTAAAFLEGNLLRHITSVQSCLYQLLELEERMGNSREAEEIAVICDKMCSLFGLWSYGAVVPHLLLAVFRKDTENTLQLVEKVLQESRKPWDMEKSSLYYRVSQGLFENQVGESFLRSFISEVRTKEEYDFLRGNAELESILQKYEVE